jgi:hypothetical protein
VPEPDNIAVWTDPPTRLDLIPELGPDDAPIPENPAGTIVLADVLDD